jgi:hypothetical protein
MVSFRENDWNCHAQTIAERFTPLGMDQPKTTARWAMHNECGTITKGMSAVAGLEMTSAILLHRLVPQLQNGSFHEVKRARRRVPFGDSRRTFPMGVSFRGLNELQFVRTTTTSTVSYNEQLSLCGARMPARGIDESVKRR